MKCFEIRKCTEQEREKCFVYLSYSNKEDLNGVKCWIMNGAFGRGNRVQLEKCLACPYYQTYNSETKISQSEHTLATVISVTGTINNDRTRGLEEVLNELLEKKRYFIVLNLADVNNIYSCGLGVIIRMHKETQARGGAFCVAGPQAYVQAIFNASKLSRFLKIYKSEREAFEAIEKKIHAEKEKQEKAKLSEEEARERERKKAMPCWEYWNHHNPKNANTCDECFRKLTRTNQPCWVVEGTVEGVSFQYVNEDCEECSYFLLHQEN